MDKKAVRIPRLILGVVVLLFAGIIYAWSVIKSPFASFGWTGSQLGLNYTLTIAMFCIGGFVSGLFENKISSKIRMIIGGALIFIGFFITSRLDGSSIIPLYIGYGLCSGFGIGIVYNIVIARTNAWFPDKKGISSGVLMMAFGFSSMLLGKLSVKLFTIDTFGWSKTYLLYAVIIGIVIAVAGLFIRYPSEEEIAPFITNNGGSVSLETAEYTTAQMAKRKSFWMLFVLFVLSTSVGTVALSFGKDILLSIKTAENVAVTVASMLAVFNGVGRLLSGFIFDKAGIKSAKLSMSFACIIASTVVLISLISANSVIGIIGICLCALSYGFAPTISAAIVGQFYGRKNFSLNFATINLILIPSSFYSTITGSIYDANQSFITVFVILIACSVIGLIDNILIKKA